VTQIVTLVDAGWKLKVCRIGEDRWWLAQMIEPRTYQHQKLSVYISLEPTYPAAIEHLIGTMVDVTDLLLGRRT
jgi:hypothetical protein